jgi:integrase
MDRTEQWADARKEDGIMADRKAPYSVVVRRGVYFYRLKGWASGQYRSLDIREDGSKKTEKKAWDLAEAEWRKGDELRTGSLTLRAYASKFYGDDCPHLLALKAEGGRAGKRYQKETRQKIENHLLKLAIMSRRVCDLTPTDTKKAKQEIVKNACADLKERMEKKGETYNGEIPRVAQANFTLLRTILRTAYEDGLVAKDPLLLVNPIKKYDEKERQAFDPAETEAFFQRENFESDLEFAVFRWAYIAGMRRGEVLALTYEQIKGDHIFVDRAWKDQEQTEIGLPKWEKTRRVPLTTPIVEFLDWWRKINPFDRKGYVFHVPGAPGVPLTNWWWRVTFEKALAKAQAGAMKSNLEGVLEAGKHLVPHSLRHTITSDLLAAGVPNMVIESVQGWSSEDMLKRYGKKHMDSRLMGAMEAGHKRIIGE